MNAAQSGGHAGGGAVGKKGSQMEELMGISADHRNWRGIFIALLVIAVVFSLIIFSIFLLTPDQENLREYGTPLTLADILSEKYQWKPFNGTWHSGSELIYRDMNGGISVLNVKTFKTDVLVSSTLLRQLNVETFSLSPDFKFVLLHTDHDVNGSRYFVYELATENIFSLGPQIGQLEEQPPRLQHVIWSPATKAIFENGSQQLSSDFIKAEFSGTNASSEKISSIWGVAFVYKNDIYYKHSVDENVLTYRLTTSGTPGVIYNGVPNWLYANDPQLSVGSKNMMQFSPDGKFLTYISLNDSLVNEYRYHWMGETSNHPIILTQRYPKYGMNNPQVTVYVVNLVSVVKFSKTTPVSLKLPPELTDKVGYVGGLQWITTTSPSSMYLSVLITNRAQTRTSTILCEAPDFECEILYTELKTNYSAVLSTEKATFASVPGVNTIDISTSISNAMGLKGASSKHSDIGNKKKIGIFSYGGIQLLKRLPIQKSSNGNHYRQIVFISNQDRRTVIPVTNGHFEVTEILGWDRVNEMIYFMAVPIQHSDEKHLYKSKLQLIHLTKINRTKVISAENECICLTCSAVLTASNNLSIHTKLFSPKTDVGSSLHLVKNPRNNERTSNNCLYNHILFSSDYSYYIQECLGPEVPSVYLVETNSNQKVLTLDAGDTLRSLLSENSLPQIRILDVKINNGFHAKVKLYIPPDIREEAETTYPLILHIDAFPGSQLVNQRFDVNWNWYLCNQKEFVVAEIDGRGSGFQGEEFRAQIYGKLGKVEVEDQLAVVKYLSDNFKFIDSSRICAYGWGYGGFATSMALAEDSQQLLRCAVAINPITMFTHFYSYLSERFMPPQGNYIQALQDTELPLRAGNMRGRNLMLIHSTADTFIHPEHTLIFVKALINQKIRFRHQIYPDEDHKIKGALSHVYEVIESYIDDCFNFIPDYDWNPSKLFLFK